MKLNNARITILINQDRTTIELHDADSNGTFVEIVLTPAQLSSALSRLSYTPCEMVVSGLDRLNKKMENRTHEFELPEWFDTYRDKALLHDLAMKSCPEGWVADNYFDRQNTFFSQGKTKYARVTIRRWI